MLTARLLPQVLLPGTMMKSPETAMLCTRSGTPPLFVSVTVTAEAARPTPVDGKVMLEKGERETPGGARPVPLRFTV